jgi:hypothetical protein
VNKWTGAEFRCENTWTNCPTRCLDVESARATRRVRLLENSTTKYTTRAKHTSRPACTWIVQSKTAYHMCRTEFVSRNSTKPTDNASHTRPRTNFNHFSRPLCGNLLVHTNPPAQRHPVQTTDGSMLLYAANPTQSNKVRTVAHGSVNNLLGTLCANTDLKHPDEWSVWRAAQTQTNVCFEFETHATTTSVARSTVRCGARERGSRGTLRQVRRPVKLYPRYAGIVTLPFAEPTKAGARGRV